jgi:hypothetical protein
MALVGILILGGATTVLVKAAIPDRSGIIHGCYSTTTGTLKVIDSSTQQCTASENSLDWQKQPVIGNSFVIDLTPAAGTQTFTVLDIPKLGEIEGNCISYGDGSGDANFDYKNNTSKTILINGVISVPPGSTVPEEFSTPFFVTVNNGSSLLHMAQVSTNIKATNPTGNATFCLFQAQANISS